MSINKVKVWFVYVDWTTEENPRPFYVGKGDITRIKCNKRNEHWNHIANKYGWCREIVVATKEEAYALEQEILGILEYGTFEYGSYGKWGANHTPGGDGLAGMRIPSLAGENNPAKRLEVRQKLRDGKLGDKNPFYKKQHPPELIEKISKSLKGKLSGEKNHQSKLTWKQVDEIRSLREIENVSYKRLAIMYKMSVMPIWDICQYKTWKKS